MQRFGKIDILLCTCILLMVLCLIFSFFCCNKTVSKKAESIKQQVKKRTVKKGDHVRIRYKAKLCNGFFFDASKKHLTDLTIGKREVIKGIEEALIGMSVSETKEVMIKAEDAFGRRKKGLMKKITKDILPKDFYFEKGVVITLKDKYNIPIPATIMEVNENDLIVDLNHPLAGIDIIVRIHLIRIY